MGWPKTESWYPLMIPSSVLKNTEYAFFLPVTLYKPRVNKNIRRDFYSNRIVDKWNCLPEHVALAPSTHKFKELLSTPAVTNNLKHFVRGED